MQRVQKFPMPASKKYIYIIWYFQEVLKVCAISIASASAAKQMDLSRKLSYRQAFKGIGGTECDTMEPWTSAACSIFGPGGDAARSIIYDDEFSAARGLCAPRH